VVDGRKLVLLQTVLEESLLFLRGVGFLDQVVKEFHGGRVGGFVNGGHVRGKADLVVQELEYMQTHTDTLST
jgi:hypothetical protein